MRAAITDPTTFFVIGMPRGGTTIVARIFNSLENGFCLGEPHWFMQARDANPEVVSRQCFGKVATTLPETFTEWDVLPWIESRLDGHYQLGGYKETWYWNNGLVRGMTEAHKDRVEFFIVVFRDPVMVHSSQVALGWQDGRSPEEYLSDYRELDALARHEKAVAVVYEDFALDPLGYLNARLPFQIDGPLVLERTGHEFGHGFLF